MAVETTISKMDVEFTPLFFAEHCVLEIHPAGNGKKVKNEETPLVRAAIAMESLRKELVPYASSNGSKDTLYIIIPKEGEAVTKDLLSDIPLSVKKLYTQNGISGSTLCDLAVKFTVSKSLGETDVLPKARGIGFFSKNGKMIIYVSFKDSKDGKVMIRTYGENIKPFKDLEKDGYPFVFSDNGILDRPESRRGGRNRKNTAGRVKNA